MVEAADPHHGPLPGEVELVEELPAGGMGRVWKAIDATGRSLVLKRLPSGLISADQLLRFGREARLLASLACPGVPRVRAFNDDPGDPYLLMDFVDGVPISRWPLPGGEELNDAVAALALGCLETLGNVHDSGVLHRDLSPRNILVDDAGKPWIIDFGIAMTDDDTGLTITGDVLGTLRYTSPEQASGTGRETLGPPSDLYSLGLVLMELLSGKPVRSGTTQKEMVVQAVTQDPESCRRLSPEVDPDLGRVLDALVAREVEDRYASAHAAAEDVRRWLDGKTVKPPKPPVRRRARLFWRRLPVPARAAAVTSAVLLASAAGWSAYRVATRTSRNLEAAARTPDHAEALALLAGWSEEYGDEDYATAWKARAIRGHHSILDPAVAEAFLSRCILEHDLPELRLARAFRRAVRRDFDGAISDLNEGCSFVEEAGELEGAELACLAVRRWLELARPPSQPGKKGEWDLDADNDRKFRPVFTALNEAADWEPRFAPDIRMWMSCASLPFGSPRNFHFQLTKADEVLADSPLLVAAHISRDLLRSMPDAARKQFQSARERFPEHEAHWQLLTALVAHGSGDFRAMAEAAGAALDALGDEPFARRRAEMALFLARAWLDGDQPGAQAAFDRWLAEPALPSTELLFLAEAAVPLGRAGDAELEARLDAELLGGELEWTDWQKRQRRARWTRDDERDPYAGAEPPWIAGLEAGADPAPSEVLDAADFGSLQAACDAAPDGARIEIPPGEYLGPVRIVRKRLTLVGTGAAATDAVIRTEDLVGSTIVVWRSPRFVLENVQVRAGNGNTFVEDAEGKLQLERVSDDARGGGLLLRESAARIRNVDFFGKGSEQVSFGGGMSAYLCAGVLVEDCHFHDNRATRCGGAMLVAKSEAVIRDTRIVRNQSASRGGRQPGIGLSEGGRIWVRGTVFREHAGPPIGSFVTKGMGGGRPFVDVRDSLVQGGWYGVGNRIWQPGD